MVLNDEQRMAVVKGLRIAVVLVVIVASALAPKALAPWIIGSAMVVFGLTYFLLGATSIFNGKATRNARTPSGYRGLELSDGEPGRDDRAR